MMFIPCVTTTNVNNVQYLFLGFIPNNYFSLKDITFVLLWDTLKLYTPYIQFKWCIDCFKVFWNTTLLSTNNSSIYVYDGMLQVHN